MSWLFSQALVEEYSGDICSDGEPSVQSNGSHTQQAYCAPDKMTDFSRLSRFGMTYKPLTENRGEELLTSYLAAFHAKTSPQPEKVQALMESEAECGEKWQGSFTKYDPNTSLWKTHQHSLAGDLGEFSETWPRWGLMQNGVCWEQQILEQITNEKEFGLLEKYPTPCTRDWKDSGKNVNWEALAKKRKLAGVIGGSPNPTWVEWLMGWPLGWTDLKPLETDKFQKWLDEHGKS